MSTTREPPTTIALGEIELTALWDGTLAAKLETIRDLDPLEARSRLDAAMAATGSDPLVLPVRAFLIRVRGKLALVDTGSGTTKGPTMGFLGESLRSAGVSPGDIDAVMLTHLHMDHIGGLLDASGRPAFPHAEIVLHHEEARYFLDTPSDRLDPRSARHVQIQRATIETYGSRVRRVSDGEGLPGVTAHLAAGHTPGHAVWRITSSGRSAVVLGDVVHLAAIQLPLPRIPMIYDVDAALAARTRIALLEDLAMSGTMVAGAHLPAPGIGQITRSREGGYAFEPLPPSR